MVRLVGVILVLLMGCAPYVPEPEPQYDGQYRSLHGKTFKADYPTVKKISQSMHSNYVKYLMPDGKTLMARRDWKKGVWNITIRQPNPHSPREMEQVERHMSKGERTND